MTEQAHKILINVEDDETRIAMVHGNTLDNLYIEQTHRTQKVGNIYSGTVIKVQPSFQAAFVDYGEERHGFLALSDINFQVHKPHREGRGRPSITQVLKPGQKILVQVIKDEIAHKGASLTTNISIPGRFLVFMPDSDRGGVSRKIEDEEQRTRLKHLLKGLGGEGASAIVRTVGVDRSLTELKRDFMILRRTWNEIQEQFNSQPSSQLLYQEEDAMVRMIRDYYHENIAEVVIDEPIAFQRALEFFQAHMPTEQKKLQLYLGEKSLFGTNQIEGQIEVLHQQQVPLPSGGSLVIMPTEALVAIDVNSGRSTQERNIEDTAFRTNMEAAEEVARQLRLRNLGGLIVVDFIDMDNNQNRLEVVRQIEKSMEADKAKTSFNDISKFGLLEMSRQRISSSLSRNSITLTLANRILRKMQDSAVDQKVLQIHIRLPLELATHLLNAKRQRLSQLEMDYAIGISITPDTQLGPEEIPEMEVTFKVHGGGETRTTVPISAADMRDDKPKKKRGRRKKSEEASTTEESTSAESSETAPTKEKKGRKPAAKDISDNEQKPKSETRSEDTPKTDDKKSSTKSSKNDSQPEVSEQTTSEAPETSDETASSSNESDVEKTSEEQTEEQFQDDAGQEKVMYTSVHEPVVENDSQESPQSEDENSKESTENTPMFNSVHLDEEDKLVESVPEVTPLQPKKVEKQTPFFNSVHIDEDGEIIDNETSTLTETEESETTANEEVDSKVEAETDAENEKTIVPETASETQSDSSVVESEKADEEKAAVKVKTPTKRGRKPSAKTTAAKPRSKKSNPKKADEKLDSASEELAVEEKPKARAASNRSKTAGGKAKATTTKAKPAAKKPKTANAKTSEENPAQEKAVSKKPKRATKPRAKKPAKPPVDKKEAGTADSTKSEQVDSKSDKQ